MLNGLLVMHCLNTYLSHYYLCIYNLCSIEENCVCFIHLSYMYSERNYLIFFSFFSFSSCFAGNPSLGIFYQPQQQQLQAQHLSHSHGPPVPLTPHPSGLQPPGMPSLGSSAGLLALSNALGGQSHLAIKDDKKHHDTDHHRGERHGKPT